MVGVITRLPRLFVLRAAIFGVFSVALLVVPSVGRADPTFDYNAHHDGVMDLISAYATGQTTGLSASQATELDEMQIAAFADTSSEAISVESAVGAAAQLDEAIPDVADAVEGAYATNGLVGAAEVAPEIAGAFIVGYSLGAGLNREYHLSCSIDGLLGGVGCGDQPAVGEYGVVLQPVGNELYSATQPVGNELGYWDYQVPAGQDPIWRPGVFFTATWWCPSVGGTCNGQDVYSPAYPYAHDLAMGSVFVPPLATSTDTVLPLSGTTSYPSHIEAFDALQHLPGFWDVWDWNTANPCHWDDAASTYRGCAVRVIPGKELPVQMTEPVQERTDAQLNADNAIRVTPPTPLACDTASECWAKVVSTFSANETASAWLGHVLDPADFPADPVTGKWTMPDCSGLSVSDCEDAVSSAAAAADASVPEYTVATLTTADPDIADDLVTAQDPAASTSGLPESVVITKNPTDTGNPMGCVPRSDDPHWSDSTGGVIAKTWVTCNYAGVATPTSRMWRCTNAPSPDLSELLAGSWGCVTAATTTKTVTVAPGVEVGPIYVPDVGAPAVSANAYFISSITVSSAIAWSPHAPEIDH